MKHLLSPSSNFLVSIGLVISASALTLSLGENWPNWRGPNFNNISGETEVPIEWSKAKNIKWRAPLPEPGNSSAVVWGNSVFVTQAIDETGERWLISFDRKSGKEQWRKGTRYAGREKRHDTNTHCAASPVTDGQRVIAHFGSAGVYCYDFQGKEMWRQDLGPQDHTWGQGSSPVIQGDYCIIYHGPGSPSKLIALNKATGKTAWEVSIPEEQPKERFDGFAGKSDGMMGSFATPIISRSAQKGEEVILPVANQLRAWELSSGKPTWHCDGMNPLVYSSPTLTDGTIVAFGGYFGSSIVISANQKGDATSKKLWYEQRAKKHRIGSPIIYKGNIYIANTDGTAECVELATGKSLWLERLKHTGANGETWASMVLVGDKLLVTNRSGDTFVLRAAPRFEQIAVSSLGEVCNATLAVSDGELFLRTHAALYCISSSARVAMLKP